MTWCCCDTGGLKNFDVPVSHSIMTSELNLFQKLHFFHRCYRYRFRTERHQIARLRSLELEGKTVLDVGGNHGIYSYWLARSVGRYGQVHYFEPQPELCTEVQAVMRWLEHGQVRVNCLALSDDRSFHQLRRNYPGDGSASLVSTGVTGDAVACESITLDGYCESQAFTELAFIKIDVEGHELAVVRGGLATLRRFRPVLQVELRVHEPSCDQVIAVLSDLGYRGFMFCDGREVALADYKSVPSSRFGFIGHRDFFFESAV